jgi:hypothetical protein
MTYSPTMEFAISTLFQEFSVSFANVITEPHTVIKFFYGIFSKLFSLLSQQFSVFDLDSFDIAFCAEVVPDVDG